MAGLSEYDERIESTLNKIAILKDDNNVNFVESLKKQNRYHEIPL